MIRGDEDLFKEMDSLAGLSSVENPEFSEMDKLAGIQSPEERSNARFIGEQLAQGTISLADLAHQLAQYNTANMTMPNEQIEEIRGQQVSPSRALKEYGDVNIEKEPLDTATRRVLGHGLRSLPAGLLGGLGGAAMAGGAGLTSGVMQEAGMPALAADLLTIPLAAGASRAGSMLSRTPGAALSSAERKAGRVLERFVGEENIPQVLKNIEAAPTYKTGYQPMTAEIAESPGLASLHRAQYEIPRSGLPQHAGEQTDKLRTALQEASPGNIVDTQEAVANRLNQLNRNAEQSVKAIGHHATGAESGVAIRKGIESELKPRVEYRKSETKPLYEKLKKIEKGYSTPNAAKFLKEEGKYAKGEQLDAVKDAADLLVPNKKESGLILPTQISASTLRKNPDLSSKFGSQNLSVPMELKSAASAAGQKIKVAKRAGADDTARIWTGFKKNLKKDLEQVPEYEAATSRYKELSPPVVAIKKNKVMGKIIKKEPSEPSQYVLTESRVPEQFLGRSEGAIDDARAFMKEVGHDKEMMKTVHHDLNRRAVEAITNKKTGKVEPHKIEAFKQAHPGVDVLYPDLFNSKLKNSANAQMMTNRYMRDAEKIESTLKKNELGRYVPGSTQGLANKIYTANNSERNVIDLLSSIGPNEAAKEGLRELTINHMMKNISNAGAEGKGSVLSHAKMDRFMRQHKKALQPLLTPEQIGLTGEVSHILKGQNYAKTKGASFGSPTEARGIIREEIGKGISLGPQKYQWLFKWFHNHSSEAALDMINKSLISPKITERILKGNFKGQTEFEKYLNDIGKLSLPVVSQNLNKEKQ